MSNYNSSIITTADNKSLFYQQWIPENKPRAIVVYVHGLGSHSGRMDHWAERFNNENIGFVAYDQRGHGKSDEKRGGPTNIVKLFNDVQLVITKVKDNFPEIPITLYGHSMGGNVVINYAIHSSDNIQGLISTSPWLSLENPPSKFLVGLVKILVKIAPGMTLSNGLDAADISRMEEEVEKYRNDPLVHPRISVGLFHSTHYTGLKAINKAKEINCPVLVMHGMDDAITSSTASKEFASYAVGNVELKLWENCYHELHHEPIREDIFNYIIKWMKDKNLVV